MDARKYMIVDLERKGDKRMFVTEQVVSIDVEDNGLLEVRFNTSPRVYKYNSNRLLFLSNPEKIDVGEKGLYVNNKHITDVAELYKFSDGRHTFYHVIKANGYYDNLEAASVYVTRTPIDKNGSSVWDYLRALATETSLLTEDDESILSKQYEKVDLKRDNVPLAQYVGSRDKLANQPTPKRIIYPFGCNASQKKAVEAALSNQLSIIQGPPGTGKTQTILNILSNLLLTGKSVLVVSNNNSAVDNVVEKLTTEGLDFLVAKLGSRENKESFVAHQKAVPDINEWMLPNVNATKAKAQQALETVSLCFGNQMRRAQLKAEYDALIKEEKYNQLQESKTFDEHWLSGKRSQKWIALLLAYQERIEQSKTIGFWFRIKWALSLGLQVIPFLNKDCQDVMAALEASFYLSRKAEIETELSEIEDQLNAVDVKSSVKTLRESSLQILKHTIAKRFEGGSRQLYNIRDIKPRTESFLKDYPIVLSTTYSAKTCISPDYVFDYVIMDEASQVDIKTGALALSCALNAVIVGDDKQLPNVVSAEEAKAIGAIQEAFSIDYKYNAAKQSFLSSCVEVFNTAPVTLLREHYRCHPQIIEFCNKRFYGGELIAMTEDNGDEDVLQVVRTVPGNHARGHFNQREIDVIQQEVMPLCSGGNTGIITPYRDQANAINAALGQDIASTVHKYQGRECDSIIMSTTDNQPTSFSDDPNLLNVAISRAKTRLCIVTTGNELPKDSNLAQLIAYMQYNNFEVKLSKLHSVFDLLYRQYTDERLAYEKTHPAISDYLSENLIYDTLTEAIAKSHKANVAVLCHYPLARLIADWASLDERERQLASSQLSHVDFLVYNTLTKEPLFAIEVDGWKYHKGSEAQQSRDYLKNQILAKCHLPLYRISTTDTVNVDTMLRFLDTNNAS